MTCLLLALGGLLAAHASEPPLLPPLPPRPAQASVAPGSCPETDIIAGEPVPPLPAGCAGIVLPLEVWAHLEDLATDSREVRERWAIDTAQLEGALEVERWKLARVEADLARERTPAPVLQRPGVQVAIGATVGAAAVLGGAWALGEVSR